MSEDENTVIFRGPWQSPLGENNTYTMPPKLFSQFKKASAQQAYVVFPRVEGEMHYLAVATECDGKGRAQEFNLSEKGQIQLWDIFCKHIKAEVGDKLVSAGVGSEIHILTENDWLNQKPTNYDDLPEEVKNYNFDK